MMASHALESNLEEFLPTLIVLVKNVVGSMFVDIP